MRTRTSAMAIRKEIELFRQRVRLADQPALLLLEHDGSSDSLVALEEAMTSAPDYGPGQFRALVIDQFAGFQNHYDPDADDDEEVRPIVQPPQRVAWDAVYPIPGIRPGREPASGRPWYEKTAAGRLIFGMTVDGEPVGLDAIGPLILEEGPNGPGA